jgi:amino-acid N-acetyltransferase
VFITSAYLDEKIDSFFVVEIDRNLVACAALHAYPDEAKAELASIVVGAGHENYGIGRRLIQHLEDAARQRGFKELICLSTQAFTYFKQKAGFLDATADDLPVARRDELSRSGRNSRILKKTLN